MKNVLRAGRTARRAQLFDPPPQTICPPRAKGECTAGRQCFAEPRHELTNPRATLVAKRYGPFGRINSQSRQHWPRQRSVQVHTWD